MDETDFSKGFGEMDADEIFEILSHIYKILKIMYRINNKNENLIKS